MRKILSILYYIFIFWAVYFASVIIVVAIQIYRHYEQKRLFKEKCSVKGHVWTHYSVEVNGFTKTYRECLRCRKKQYFRPNKGYKNE